MDKIKKVFACEIKQVGDESERILRFVGSDETPDRDNDIIEVGGWKLDDYLKNPVFLWAHDYESPPVGKAVNVMTDAVAKKLLFDIKFPTAEEYPFADTIYKLYKGGYLSATSVGFRGIKHKTRDEESVLELPEWQRGRRYTEQVLLELSGCPVPCNPNALIEMRSKGFKNEDIDKVFFDEKGAIPYKKCPLADEDEAWDGPSEIAAAEVDDLKQMCAWYDDTSPDVKQSYKLPHHTQADKNTVWRAVTAAMGALLGARGGVDIPEDDRKGTYEHLAKHYADFDREAPEFKDYTEAEIKEMFPEETKAVNTTTKTPDTEGNPSSYDIEREIQNLINPNYLLPGVWEVDLYPINYPSGKVVICRQSKYFMHNYTYEKVNDVVKITLDEGVEVEIAYNEKALQKRMEQKTGAALSAKNRETLQAIHDDLNKCHGTMKGCGDKLKEFIEGTMPMMPDDEPMMSAQMTAPMMEPMMSAMRTAEIAEIKQALDEIKSQVLILCQKTTDEPPKKDAPKDEINLDAIELPEPEKDPADIELNIEPGELKTMIDETVKNLIQGGK